MALDSSSTLAIATATLLMLTLWAMRRSQRHGSSRRSTRKDAIDTVIGWQPEASRVLTSSETQAFEILVRSMPDHRVLAQVPLSRFLRVPTRNSYGDWLNRVGNLNADLLLCDAEARVLAVIDVRATQESERSRRRHERMTRVLRAAGIPVHVWNQDRLPTVADVRAQLDVLLTQNRQRPFGEPAAWSSTSRPMPLIPVPDITEVLAEGDALAAQAELQDPVASGFFDDLDMGTAGNGR